ncbi:hypothetical protein SODALDRAFT_377393 [Sodiomyces alkalinus F11]|uniref:Uncharacterized protein n=1 Tax=Sodiomyces alkalinus (strain CBS 110278 / VKM F-3762 / F11) TaxID=1314773 RepID=A0A3N2Q4W3_SODAK|nr:hypothetical protein SODALDRAFT_377393 [Sodiomyces alkalinus F11]ROT41737.1 hypothetical protein SODALDRAFT_377393 [Sodiomyces alkalinus F11]
MMPGRLGTPNRGLGRRTCKSSQGNRGGVSGSATMSLIPQTVDKTGTQSLDLPDNASPLKGGVTSRVVPEAPGAPSFNPARFRSTCGPTFQQHSRDNSSGSIFAGLFAGGQPHVSPFGNVGMSWHPRWLPGLWCMRISRAPDLNLSTSPRRSNSDLNESAHQGREIKRDYCRDGKTDPRQVDKISDAFPQTDIYQGQQGPPKAWKVKRRDAKCLTSSSIARVARGSQSQTPKYHFRLFQIRRFPNHPDLVGMAPVAAAVIVASLGQARGRVVYPFTEPKQDEDDIDTGDLPHQLGRKWYRLNASTPQRLHPAESPAGSLRCSWVDGCGSPVVYIRSSSPQPVAVISKAHLLLPLFLPPLLIFLKPVLVLELNWPTTCFCAPPPKRPLLYSACKYRRRPDQGPAKSDADPDW